MAARVRSLMVVLHTDMRRLVRWLVACGTWRAAF
jgi:hypothetical protein